MIELLGVSHKTSGKVLHQLQLWYVLLEDKSPQFQGGNVTGNNGKGERAATRNRKIIIIIKKEQTQRMGNGLGWFCFHS